MSSIDRQPSSCVGGGSIDRKQTWYQKPRQVEFHAVSDSPSITLIVAEEGTIAYEKTAKRVPIDQVRKQREPENQKKNSS